MNRQASHYKSLHFSLQQATTKGGGAAQSARLSGEMVITLTNGICYDPIILGSIANSKVNEYVNLEKLKSQVAIPNLQFKNLVPKYGVYIVTKARLVTNTLVTQDMQGQHYYDQDSQFVIAYPLSHYTLPMYDTQAHSLVGFEVMLSQTELTAQIKDFIIAIAKYMYDHYQDFESVAWLGERHPYATMDKAIDQVVDGINKVEGSFMPWSTSKLFGIYAQGRLEDGNISLPNTLIDQVREKQADDIDESKQAYDQLLQGDHTYVSSLLHTDILGNDSVSSIKRSLKAYWQTNPQVNAIIISKGE